MSFLAKRKASISLRALQQKVPIEALAYLQPILLLRVLLTVSQSLQGRIPQPEALARTLLLDGQQRLRKLLDAAPRLNLPLDKVAEIIHANDADDDLTPEEDAVQALLEMCLALMLRWMSQGSRATHLSALSNQSSMVSSHFPPLSSCLLPSILRPPRTRACPIASLA